MSLLLMIGQTTSDKNQMTRCPSRPQSSMDKTQDPPNSVLAPFHTKSSIPKLDLNLKYKHNPKPPLCNLSYLYIWRRYPLNIISDMHSVNLPTSFINSSTFQVKLATCYFGYVKLYTPRFFLCLTYLALLNLELGPAAIAVEIQTQTQTQDASSGAKPTQTSPSINQPRNQFWIAVEG